MQISRNDLRRSGRNSAIGTSRMSGGTGNTELSAKAIARLMAERPLLNSGILQHAANFHADTQIVSRLVDGSIHRYTYAEAERRSRQLAQALLRLGIAPGDRVGTMAWNTFRHFELYY